MAFVKWISGKKILKLKRALCGSSSESGPQTGKESEAVISKMRNASNAPRAFWIDVFDPMLQHVFHPFPEY